MMQRPHILIMLCLASASCLNSSAKIKCHTDADCLDGLVCQQGTCARAGAFSDAAIDANLADRASAPDNNVPIDAQTDLAADCNGSICGLQQACNVDRCMSKAQYSNGFLCTAQEPCPNPQVCLNGLCAHPCEDIGDCAETLHCDIWGSYLCVPDVVQSCPPALCESNQTCLWGLCVTVQSESTCTPTVYAQDGCDSWHRCVELPNVDGNVARCVTLPACPFEGQCPEGTWGSTCNSDLITEKNRLCMLGLCANSTDCANGDACAALFSQRFGICTDGALEAFCDGGAFDCQDPLFCHQPDANSLGQCQVTGSIACTDAGGTCWDLTTNVCPGDTMLNSNYTCLESAMDCCL